MGVAMTAETGVKSPELGIKRYKRVSPPAHYMLKIESFSLVSSTVEEKYESNVFEVGGYEWRLAIYPNGNKKADGNNHLSLSLVIQNTDKMSTCWEVNAKYKFFVLDQLRTEFLTIKDADRKNKQFHAMKTEWGVARSISLDCFNDPTNGYIVEDSCIFGVEVFVSNWSCKMEWVSIIRSPVNNVFVWEINKISKLKQEYHQCLAFTVQGSRWKLLVFPNGFSTKRGTYLSLYLRLDETRGRVYAEFKLRLRNQIDNSTHDREARYWFLIQDRCWGFADFISLQELKKKFIRNDRLIVEAEILVTSEVK